MYNNGYWIMDRQEFTDKCIAFSVKINKLRKYLLLYGSELILKNQYDELMLDVEEMYRILTASIKTAKSKLK